MQKIVLIFLLLCTACQREYVVNETSFFAMDTYVNVKLFDNKKDEKILNDIKDIFLYYDCIANRYRACDVNVYQINHMVEESMVIDQELIYLINYGNQLYKETDGLFDIGMGHLIDVWKKAIENGGPLPSNKLLDAIERNEIVIEKNQIYRGANLDLGAIAKGHSVQKAVELLKKNGYDKYIINAGGQVAVGEKYRETPYNVGVRHPLLSENLTVIRGENLAVSTSGNYERFFEIDGKKYSHIINPKTKYPAEHIASVTVVTNDSLLADVLTTVLFLMPVEDGIEYLKKYDAEAIWVLKDEQIIRSEGFRLYE